MAIRIFNTQTHSIEPFETLEQGAVRMYVCGVTVYDDAHIGHAMSAMVFDIIRRYFEWREYRVTHIVNFTDVDDKIIARAHKLEVDPAKLAEQYVGEFQEQLRQLNVLPATYYPRATQTMPEIITFVETLIEKGHAYAVDGDVYFRVRSYSQYGKLSGRNLEDMLKGTRFEPDSRKEDSADFALWKSAKPGEPFWASPWGNGRPGWHIECSAMNLKHLGEQIDIHGGGNDLVFPHHENEIAQTESLTGKIFARYWMHNGMLQLVNPQTKLIEKMSKSLGNVVTIRDFLKQYDADVFRLIVLGSHYRKPLTYNSEVAEDNRRKLERLMSAFMPAVGNEESGEAAEALKAAAETAKVKFTEAMDDDFNTSGALAALFDLVRAVNVGRDAGLGATALGAAQSMLRDLGGVLGLRLTAQQGGTQSDIKPFVDLLIETRNALRKAKQFELADNIRKQLLALGVTLEDTAQGTRWKI